MSQEEVERLGSEINKGMCSKTHPNTPCIFWHHSWGAVPEAVTRVPFNNLILCTDLMKWPEPASGESLNACSMICTLDRAALHLAWLYSGCNQKEMSHACRWPQH